MGIASQPSKLSLPHQNPGVITVLDYLIIKFPAIKPLVWQQRMVDGKVHWHDGSLIKPETLFRAQQRVYYYREVEREPIIPFVETVLFHDEHILVAHKPHFQALIPGGVFVNQCLQSRLRLKTGIDSLQVLHRLDRVTAGLVLFSTNPDTRHLYHQLFENRQIQKTYQAIACVSSQQHIVDQHWQVKNRLEPSELKFRMHVVAGEANSHSVIRCLRQHGDKALFELNPITGKTHQLRVHMQSLGWPILNDKYYPILEEKSPDNFLKPLQLLAKQLRFVDPVTQQPRNFCNPQNLPSLKTVD
ncbi:MAG: tRNA pseudouridine32 synthase/23S rRNA pseudouridine746 synthase [Oceanicoccus sp.]|jgi:tRNA pseudouridine32 synthase/23S rRNA pseudouridine746 synthase